MQFVVIAYDGTDEDALNRRLAIRDTHMAQGEKMRAAGKFLFGGAILDDGKMIGSLIVVNFSSKEELDAWLEVEPYVTNNVWQKIEIKPLFVPPQFLPV
jgi:uncharacterized protein YciI